MNWTDSMLPFDCADEAYSDTCFFLFRLSLVSNERPPGLLMNYLPQNLCHSSPTTLTIVQHASRLQWQTFVQWHYKPLPISIYSLNHDVENTRYPNQPSHPSLDPTIINHQAYVCTPIIQEKKKKRKETQSTNAYPPAWKSTAKSQATSAAYTTKADEDS